MKFLSRFKTSSIRALIVSFLLLLAQGFLYAIVFSLTKKESIAYLLTYLLFLIILVTSQHKKLIEDAKNIKTAIKGNIKKLLFSYIIFTILMYISNVILFHFLGSIAENETSTRALLFESPLIMSLVFCLLGPILEELMFRYPYRDVLTNKYLKLGIYTLAFASLHIMPVNNLTNLFYLIPYTFLSLSIGFAYFKTNNIYTSIFFHILNNTYSIILLLVFGG